ncbi:MAG: SAM-dependent methyltransferase [Micromonosporaceae bacterium]
MHGMKRWRAAMRQALYAPGGFFVSGPGPAAHFRTSSLASAFFADALLRVLENLDAALGRPRVLQVVEVGAGRAELLRTLAERASPELVGRLQLTAVELAPPPFTDSTPARPGEVPSGGAGPRCAIDWCAEAPSHVTGLLLAAEWLDNVPLDLVETDQSGRRRVVLVDGSGSERLGEAPTGDDAAWLDRWWPADPSFEPDGEPGARAEIGWPRDDAWARAVRTLDRGLALAIDYGHVSGVRPAGGTLTGYRHGRQVTPTPDGTCDLTAHVAIDAVAAAGESATGSPSQLLDQRTALHALGISGARPSRQLAVTDPAGYVRQLAAASEAAELTDRRGLGAHYWLLQPVGMPEKWRATRPDMTSQARRRRA